MTVSRVLNNSGYVAAPMRERVEKAIADLGYVPNQVARSLRSRRTGTIALVLSDITNPFFTTVARGVEDAASDAGNLVLLCNTDEREDEESRYIRMLVEQRVDGILLVPARTGEESIRLARRHGIKVVILDRRSTDTDVDVVRCDSEAGAAELARLLLDLGHRSFAILAGPSGVSTTDDRVMAFQSVLQVSGCKASVFYGEFRVESGHKMVRDALSAEPRPTALFATNNFQSIGALQELHGMGLKVPEDVALVGFDDLPAAMVTFPFLTVASQPAYEMGRRAVDLLLRRLGEDIPSPREELILPATTIVRGSSGSKLGY